MTISRKLYLSFGVALAFTLILGTTTWITLTRIKTQISLSSSSTRQLELAGDVETLTSNMLSQERAIVVRTVLKDQAKVEEYNSQFLETAAKRQEIIQEEASSATSEKAKLILRELTESYEPTLQAHQALYRLAKAGDGLGAGESQSSTLPMAKATGLRAQTVKQIANEQLAEIAASVDSTASSSVWLIAVMIFLSVGIGALVIYLVKGINEALTQTVIELSGGADQIASASSQVSSSSQSLAQGASEQAASLEETSASAEEINSMAHKNTENAMHMARLVGESKEEFVNTNRQLGEMMTAMDGINESSGKIAKIIKIIDEIAFQTNILALNAAVEAARAGEAGMGFSVVADEVRTLAQRSAQAAKDTAALIEDSVTKSEAGKAKLGGVVVSIQRISNEFTSIGTIVDEVSHGSKEQSTGIDQIGKALAQMEKVTQTTAANSEESASAAEELNAQSQSMKELTERLNEMVGVNLDNGLTLRVRSGAGSLKPSTPARRVPATPVPFASKPFSASFDGRTSTPDSFPLEESFSSF